MPGDRVELEVRLTGLAAVQTGMRRVRDAIHGPLEGAISSVRGLAASIGASLLAGFSFYRISAELKQALGDLDKTAEMSQKVGLLTDALSALEVAAGLSQMSAEEFHTSLKFLAKAVTDDADALQTLGVSSRDQGGALRSLDAVLLDVADKFAAMPNGVQKTALAVQLFGRSGLSMIPLLNEGADGIRRMTDEASAFGMVVAPEAAAAAAQVSDNFDRLSMAVRGVFRSALAELLPALVDLTNRLVSWLKETEAVRKASELLAEGLRYVILMAEGMGVVATVLFNTLRAYIRALGEAFTALAALIRRSWETPIEVFRAFIEYVKAAIRAVVDLGEAMGLLATGRFSEAKAKAKEAGEELVAAMTKAAAATVAAFAKSADAVVGAVEAPVKVAEATVSAFIIEAEKGLMSLGQTMTKLWMPARGQGVVPGFQPDQQETPDEGAAERRKRITRELREAEDQLRQKRWQISQEISALEADFSVKEADKHQKRIELLREELALLDTEIRRLQERIALEPDAQARDSLGQSMRGLENERRGVEGNLSREVQAADPYSVRDQILTTMTDLENQMGTTAQSLARQFSQVIGSAVDSVQQGIEGLIKGTITWGDALRNIGSSIINSVISAIARMFAEWITKRALMAAKNILCSTQEGAADVSAKAPGALMSSISSYGVAAVVGIAALIAAIAAINGAFAQGGVVRGPGGPTDDSILARLSNGEGVLTADAVRFYGEGIVSAMNQRTARFYGQRADEAGTGQANGMSAASGQAAPSARSSTVSLVLVDDRKEAKQYIESSEGEAHIIRVVRKHRLDLGISS